MPAALDLLALGYHLSHPTDWDPPVPTGSTDPGLIVGQTHLICPQTLSKVSVGIRISIEGPTI